MVKFTETEKRMAVARLGEEAMGSSCIMCMAFQFGKMKSILETGGGEDCTTVWMCLMPLRCTLRNYVAYILPQ